MRGEYALDGDTVEVEGQADIIIRFATDKWQVVDLKVSIGETNKKTRERYRTQVNIYEDLWNHAVEGEVESAVETVGIRTERFTSPWPNLAVEKRHKDLIAKSRAN